MEPPMTEESIPELLARLEREHVRNGKLKLCKESDGEWPVTWPCDVVRLVAHIRSLEACAYCYPEFDELCTGCQARAALGEAQ
jgi:hypothetical protein